MIEFEDALEKILDNTPLLPTKKVLIEESTGMMLTENIDSNLNMPPFDKSSMDGYAVIAENTKNAPVKLKCIGIVQAGDSFAKTIKSGSCVKIMTGAPIPKGADGVVKIENTNQGGESVEILKSIDKMKDVSLKGELIKSGQRVINKDTVISPSHISLLATVGKKSVNVIGKPTVGIISTGHEIVPVGEKLGKNKIYNSNGPQLSAILEHDSIKVDFIGIANDDEDEMTQLIEEGLKKDILLISGGVSVGDYDIVPKVLKKLNVKEIFHKVKIKPGKPLFFGRRKNTIIFGIPGNPVPNFLAYLIFVKPAINKMMGRNTNHLDFLEGVMSEKFFQKVDRKHFVLIKAKKRKDKYHLVPVPCNGSSDIFALSKANGFMVVDQDKTKVRKMAKVDFITWEDI